MNEPEMLEEMIDVNITIAGVCVGVMFLSRGALALAALKQGGIEVDLVGQPKKDGLARKSD